MMSNKDIALSKGIKPEFIKTIDGVDCVLYAGLLDLAHNRGIPDSQRKFLGFDKPEIVKIDFENKECVVIAVAKFENNFSVCSIGHTSAKNIGGDGHFSDHFIVIAETRAKARALRDALNIPLVSKEELYDTKYEKNNDKPSEQSKPAPLSEAQKKRIMSSLNQLGKTESDLKSSLQKLGVETIAELNVDQASKIIKKLDDKIIES